MRPAFIPLVVVLLSLALTCPALGQADPPAVGAEAPPLAFSTTLDDTPPPTLEDLKGQAVVLEFWAPWCSPCIAAFPHLNELVEAFEGRPISFISVTSSSDSPPETVRRLLERRPLKTQVVFDDDHATFGAYGVRMIPATVLIDPNGRITAITEPELVTAEVLEKLLAGDSLDLPTRRQQPADLDWHAEGLARTSAVVGQVLLEFSTATGGAANVGRENGEIVADGVSFAVLVQLAYDAAPHELEMPRDLYEGAAYRVYAAAADPETARKMLRGVLHAHFDFGAEWRETQGDVPVLRRAGGATREPAHERFRVAAQGEQGGGARSGNIVAQRVRMEYIANAIGAFGFGGRAIDETGLDGEYDIDLRWTPGDRESLLAALREIGLEVTMERRPIRRLHVSRTAE